MVRNSNRRRKNPLQKFIVGNISVSSSTTPAQITRCCECSNSEWLNELVEVRNHIIVCRDEAQIDPATGMCSRTCATSHGTGRKYNCSSIDSRTSNWQERTNFDILFCGETCFTSDCCEAESDGFTIWEICGIVAGGVLVLILGVWIIRGYIFARSYKDWDNKVSIPTSTEPSSWISKPMEENGAFSTYDEFAGTFTE